MMPAPTAMQPARCSPPAALCARLYCPPAYQAAKTFVPGARLGYQTLHSERRPSSVGRAVVCQAAAAPAAAAPKQSDTDKPKSVELAIAVLEQAASKRDVPGPQVIKAMSTLEKAKLPPEEWPAKLGTGPSGGARWRVIFQSRKEQIQAVLKGEKPLIPGYYMPITFVQRFDEASRHIEGGAYLGHIAALTFNGDFSWKRNTMPFTFNECRVRVGPKWFTFNLTPKDTSKKPPEGVFTWIIATDTICAARGKSGGLALWHRTDPSWEASAGVA